MAIVGGARPARENVRGGIDEGLHVTRRPTREDEADARMLMHAGLAAHRQVFWLRTTFGSPSHPLVCKGQWLHDPMAHMSITAARPRRILTAFPTSR